jgi:hypothetical protein
MPNQITSYRFGHATIDGRSYDKDLILLQDRVIERWWRKEGHNLRPEDLQAVFEAGPEVLVVGQGAYGMMAVAPETEQALETAGIELIAQPTGQAVETYNQLQEERPVAAALHLTC